MDTFGFPNGFSFNESSSTPLYRQLAEYLGIRIRSGALKPGDRMIPENDIVSSLKISRTTVRQAFDMLVEEGLIVRYRGKGTFVAEQRLRRNINYLYNFTENIRASGSVPSSTVLHCGVIEADSNEQSLLQLDGLPTRIFVLERLRLADGNPLIRERTCIPYFLCPGIETVDFSICSLYGVLRDRYNLNIDHAEETFEAVILPKGICEMLKVPYPAPGYAIERITSLENGCVCEHTTSYTRADRCVFRLELHTGADNRKRSMDFERRILPNP